MSSPLTSPTSLGQEYLSHVVENWQVLRERNILNAQHAQVVETKVASYFKQSSHLLHDYETATHLLATTLPTVTAQVEAINDSVSNLFQQINELEILRQKLIESKNSFLIDQYQLLRNEQLKVHHSALDKEYDAQMHLVNQQRTAKLHRAVDEFKGKIQSDYDAKLKMYIAEQNLSTPTKYIPSPVLATPVKGIQSPQVLELHTNTTSPEKASDLHDAPVETFDDLNNL